MPANRTSSVSLAAMPTAGQVPATGTRSAVLAANSRLPSGVAAVTSASVTECAPEQYCLMPSRRQPRPARLAVSAGPGGCAAQTPQRVPAGGVAWPSSARMASASAWPSASRPSERSSPARSARTAQRSRVRPPPGSGRFSRPDSTAARNAAATAEPGQLAVPPAAAFGSPAVRSTAPCIDTPLALTSAAQRRAGQTRTARTLAALQAAGGYGFEHAPVLFGGAVVLGPAAISVEHDVLRAQGGELVQVPQHLRQAAHPRPALVLVDIIAIEKPACSANRAQPSSESGEPPGPKSRMFTPVSSVVLSRMGVPRTVR